MPFTPSHAVVALPFMRTPLVPAAIAIGAMTPDLPLFVRGLGLDYSFTHTLANVVWTAVLAFVLFLVWRAVLRPAVPELTPVWIASRLPEEWRDGGIRALGRAVGRGEKRLFPLLLAVSLVLGVLSHIVWDLFTHEGRWGVALLPALDEMWGPLLGYKWLQHGSSAIGLALIGIWALLWLRRHRPRPTPDRRLPEWARIVWWLSLPVILVCAWIAGLLALGPLDAEFTIAHLAYRVLPPACAVWGLGTLLLCLALQLRRPSHQHG
ncbi:DUF4184 family protein [Microbacterium sp. 179-I 3D2 NHS]|uniref:DUF4184 family protein n=1 Tax=Microbacterium sp. 179-I 3D2 NHS TaxID=3235178 RepID=UPI0039A239FE